MNQRTGNNNNRQQGDNNQQQRRGHSSKFHGRGSPRVAGDVAGIRDKCGPRHRVTLSSPMRLAIVSKVSWSSSASAATK